MKNYNREQLYKAAKQFCFEGEVQSIEPYGNGHINNTYLLISDSLGKEIKYILQSVNTLVFKEPVKLIENIEKVTEFLSRKADSPREVLHLIPAKSGLVYYKDEDGSVFRMYDFITDSICLEHPESTEDFRQCAVAFGRFQKYLNDFPAESLFETIPDFHNTVKRYKNFLEAVNRDSCGRAKDVQKEIDFVKARADFYGVLHENQKAGKLPLRVTHNDTKSNNVMIDAKTRKALCVIDLDTIMPGYSVTDFGDAIRFGASTATEDEKDLSKVSLDLDMFRVYAEGFLEGCGGMLSKDEIMLLPEGAKMMTIECGMRFLTDYLDGDVYFRTGYAEHNLVRCKTQFKLVYDMEQKWEDMKEIVLAII